MLRASRALRRDDRHIELRPWLYRLTRNCALDELARVRTDSVDLDDAEDWGVLRAPAATEPEAVVERRGKVRDLLGDIATLPAQQRHALLRREVDGISHAALADRARRHRRRRRRTSSTARARTSSSSARRARATARAVRPDLLEAHDDGRRASAATYRHLASCCRDCRRFRGGLREGHAQGGGDPRADAADGGRLRAADRQGRRGDGEGRDASRATATAAAGVAITAGAVGVGVQVFGRRRPGAAVGDEPRAARRARWPRAARVPEGHARSCAGRCALARRARADRRRSPCPRRPARGGPDRRPRRERELRAGDRGRRQPQRDACSSSRGRAAQGRARS